MRNQETQALAVLGRPHLFVGLMMVVAVSCKDDGTLGMPEAVELVQSAVTTTASLSFSLPQTVSATSVALGASRSLVISTSDNVLETFAGAATVTNTGQQQTVVSSSSRVGDLWSDAFVQLGPNSRVEGALRTTRFVQKDPSAVITGGIVNQAVVSAPFLTSWNISYEATASNDVTVNSGQTSTLAPGRYRNVKVSSGGTLRLSAGQYVFTSLKNLAGGKMFVHTQAGPIRAYVLSELVSEGTVKIGDGDHGKFLIGYLGTARAFIRSPFTGMVVAPNGKTTIAPGAPQAENVHTGAFFGLDLEVSPGATIVHVGYKDWGGLTAPACSDPNLASRIPAPFTLKDFFNLCPQGRLPRLAPPISAGESRTIRDGFSWTATQPLKNFSRGVPAFYYALIYIQDKAELAALDDLRIHYDTLPLFAEERERWAGQVGILAPAFDGEGAFVFAVIPGLTYNLIRESALCGNQDEAQETFRVIQLREPPVPEARNPDGTLNYDYLSQEGFRYRGLPNCPDAEIATASGDEEGGCHPAINDPSSDAEIAAAMGATSGSGVSYACSLVAPPPDGGMPWGFSIGKRLKRLAKAAVNITKKIQDLGRKGLAVASRFFKGSANLTVALEIRNSDPGFGGRGQVMLRPWGARRGQPVPLEGVEVRALQQITFSFRLKVPSIDVGGFKTPEIISPSVSGVIPFDSLSTGRADAAGTARIKVVKRSTTGICVRLKNQAAEVLNWIFPQDVCSFQNPVIQAANLTGDRTLTVPIEHPYANILAQFTESHGYMRDVVGHPTKRASILVGPLAIASQGRAYAPCFGFPMWRDPYGALLGALGQGAVHEFVEPVLRKGANLAAEAFSQATVAVDRWLAAQAAAAGTAAENEVNDALAAVRAARDAAFTARAQAIAAATAAADLTEAARRLTTLQRQGVTGTPLDNAKTAVETAAQAARTAAAAADAAARTAAAASAAAVAAGEAALVAATAVGLRVVADAAHVALKLADALFNSTVDGIARGLSAALALVGRTAGEIIGAVLGQVIDVVMADVDIVIPDGNSMRSRGVATHEFGHFAFCDMMYRTNPFQFGFAWPDIIGDTVVSQILGVDRTFIENAYINEGFADFFAAQVAGGVNYFFPDQFQSMEHKVVDPMGNETVVWDDPMAWCTGGVANDYRCIEDNLGARGLSNPHPVPEPLIPGTAVQKQTTVFFQDNPDPTRPDFSVGGFDRQVSRIASTIHDAFDGHSNSPAADLPGNGAAWRIDPGSPALTRVFINAVSPSEDLDTLSLHEERVAVPGSGLPVIVRRWLDLEPPLATLDESTFFQGLSSVMRSHATDDEVCRLFVNHQTSDNPPSFCCPQGVDPVTGRCHVVP